MAKSFIAKETCSFKVGIYQNRDGNILQDGDKMYFKNGRLFENFLVEEKTQTLDKVGRPKTNFEFKATGEIIRGVIADAKASEIEKWRESQHLITHTILQKLGKIKAKPGDRLVNGSRFFYVIGVDDVAMRGYFILYYVEERNDAN